MKLSQSGSSDYEARIRRAQLLGKQHAFAAEPLSFYVHIATFQKNLYAQIPPAADSPPSRSGYSDEAATHGLRSQLELSVLVPHLPDLLSLLGRHGPAPIMEAARQLSLQGPAAWISYLADFWHFGGFSPAAVEQSVDHAKNGDVEPLTQFILRAFLQPYAEFRAAQMPEPQLDATSRVCPLCGSAPLLGVLRPEGDGGKRRLVCPFCLCEWDFRRILCPTCGEETENKLPVYVAEQFPHVRVEACDTCKFFLRTIDLTKDGHAVPLVDDLAAIPLTLWAHEHGYSRLQTNLLGT